jgi:hypothetical protein
MAAAPLRYDALKAKVTDLLPQRLAIPIGGRGRPVVAFEAEVFEQLATFPVGPAMYGSAVDREHVKDDQRVGVFALEGRRCSRGTRRPPILGRAAAYPSRAVGA